MDIYNQKGERVDQKGEKIKEGNKKFIPCQRHFYEISIKDFKDCPDCMWSGKSENNK